MKKILLLLCLSAGLIAAAESYADPIPNDAPLELKRLLGEYRSADAQLTVYESEGRLYADGLGLHQMRLRRLSPTQFVVDAPSASPEQFRFELNAAQQPVSVNAGGASLQFRDIGRETMQKIRAGVKADAGGLRAAALAAKPPSEPPAKRPFDLVDLTTVDIHLRFIERHARAVDQLLAFRLAR